MAAASIVNFHTRQREKLANGIDTVWNRATPRQQTEMLALITRVQHDPYTLGEALKRVAEIDRASQRRAA